VKLLKKRYFKAFLQFIEVLLAAFHIFGWSIVWQPNWLSHKISFCFYIILKKFPWKLEVYLGFILEIRIYIKFTLRIYIRNLCLLKRKKFFLTCLKKRFDKKRRKIKRVCVLKNIRHEEKHAFVIILTLVSRVKRW